MTALAVHDASAARGVAAAAEIVSVACRLERLGLVVGSTGNVSVRFGEALMITPTRVPYAELAPQEVVTVTAAGDTAGAGGRPSRELALHRAIYELRPDVHAVVHTHSPYATAWSVLARPLPDLCEDFAYYGMGPVAVADWAPPGSRELARRCATALGDGCAVLLARHGLVTVGADLGTAVIRAQVVEHQAQVAWLVAGARTEGRP